MSEIHHASSVVAQLEEDFLRAVTITATYVFDSPPGMAEGFRRHFAELSPEARLLALHESPLDVVSGFGLEITPEIEERYDAISAFIQSPGLFVDERGGHERAILGERLRNALSSRDLPPRDIKDLVRRLTQLREG